MQIEKFTRLGNDSFTVINNTIARDPRASLKARGLYLTIMSLPPTWDFSIAGIASILTENRDTIYRIINSLIDLGYCGRYCVRDNGKIVKWVYCFGEPDLVREKLVLENQELENQAQLNKQVIKYGEEIPTSPHTHTHTYVRVGEEYVGTGDDFFANLEVNGPKTGEDQMLIDVTPPESKGHVVPIPDTAHRHMYRICFLAETVEQAKFLDSRQRGRVASVLGKLRDAEADFNKLTLFEEWWKKFWKSRDSMSKMYQPPTPEQVFEHWVMGTKDSLNGSQPTKPVVSGPSLSEIEQVMKNSRR